MKKVIKKFFSKMKLQFEEKTFRINVNKVSRDIIVKETCIEFQLKSVGEFDFFTTILVRAQQNDRSISFNIGQKNEVQTVSIFLTREKLVEMETVRNVREFFTEIRIPVKNFTKEPIF